MDLQAGIVTCGAVLDPTVRRLEIGEMWHKRTFFAVPVANGSPFETLQDDPVSDHPTLVSIRLYRPQSTSQSPRIARLIAISCDHGKPSASAFRFQPSPFRPAPQLQPEEHRAATRSSRHHKRLQIAAQAPRQEVGYGNLQTEAFAIGRPHLHRMIDSDQQRMTQRL